MQIELSLEQLVKFIPKLVGTGKNAKTRALYRCMPILKDSLIKNVFQKPHSDTVTIESKSELANLIRRGANHNPAEARAGPAYNQEYLERKRSLGENMPHKFMDYGFWDGTRVVPSGNSIKMEAKSRTHKGFPYMEHHEQRRSVLKRAFLDSWQRLIGTIIDQLAKEALKS